MRSMKPKEIKTINYKKEMAKPKVPSRLKIIWDGNVFNNTGIATANRMLLQAILKHDLADVQILDAFMGSYDFDPILLEKQKVIDGADEDARYVQANPSPQLWFRGLPTWKNVVSNLYEGTVLKPGWAASINGYSRQLIVPSKANKNLFCSNGVIIPTDIVPFGIDTDLFKPEGDKIEIKVEHEKAKSNPFVFLNVNSWSLGEKDRKGTDVLVQAFSQEFTKEDNVLLFLKISTFFKNIPQQHYENAINLLSKDNPDVLVVFETGQMPKEGLAKLYRTADCFVCPTRAESWGMTISEAMATGLPVIVTKDFNSGHMDFCRGPEGEELEGVKWVELDGYSQGDPQFFPPGNMQADPSIKSLRKQMRAMYELWEKDPAKLKKIGAGNRQRTLDFTWEKSAMKFCEILLRK